jgi:predicted lipid-binding transport protein (Tim44 family)
MDFLDFGTIFFLVAAVIIFYQLRSVLGRRTGNERRPFDPYTARERLSGAEEGARDNIVALPKRIRRKGEDEPERYADLDRYAQPGTPLNAGLRAIRDADPSFTVEGFIEGARLAYEMIVMAYADGDRKALKNLLSKEVYQGFDEAITAREQRSERVQSSFVGISRADIINAVLKGSEAQITVRIVSELISATLNKSGEVIEGDPETVAEVKDVWTFARDTRSRDPNWKLIATEAED